MNKNIKRESWNDFSRYLPERTTVQAGDEIPSFKVFRRDNFLENFSKEVPFIQRDFFKICYFTGHTKIHLGNDTMEIRKRGLFFGNPQIPYKWEYLEPNQQGYFAIFTPRFFDGFGHIFDYPVFRKGGQPLYSLDNIQEKTIESIFDAMVEESHSRYPYKHDVIRGLLQQLIHLAQKTLPPVSANHVKSGSAKLLHDFHQILESQFPILSKNDVLTWRSPMALADKLSVHVNYLNRVVKQCSGRTTTQYISDRLLLESKRLLATTHWSIAEIADVLDFREPPHFINFFKKGYGKTPAAYRKLLV